MGWARIRGAPRRLPVDGRDLLDPVIDVTARTAWLLRVSRLASPWGSTTAERFVDRLTEVGYPGRHASQVSLWESGRVTTSLGLVGAYERALDLAPGELLGAVGGMQQTARIHAVDRQPADRAQVFRRLSQLDERIVADIATGADWIALAELLTDPRVTPPAESTVRRWAYTLSVQMLRSGHFDYSSRWSALSILLADPLFAEPVEAEIVSAIAEPGVPLARNGWDALSQATRPGIARSLIDRLVPGDDERSLGLAFGLATMIGRVELSRDDVFRLRPRLRLLVDDGSAAEQAMGYMLAGRLGPTTMSELGHPPAPVWTRRSYVEKPPHYEQYVDAVRRTSGIEHDAMIERLLQEALSEVLLEKQQMANQLISASPYRDAVALTAVEVATSSPDPIARHAAANMLRQLAPDDRVQLTRLLDSPDPHVVTNGIVASGRGGVQEAAARLTVLCTDPRYRAEALMALGMLGHQVRVDSAVELRASQWWMRHRGDGPTPGSQVV